ncbi:MAG: DUF4340 domain-containing protein [Gemmatimonadaceae bacterium]|nr:DUF4340 domain-containing protein [Gemmatimonadaceae bacterium]
MNLKTALLISILFVCVLGALLYSNRTEQAAEEADVLSRELLVFDKSEADELTVDGPKGRVVCRKVGDQWRIVEPIDVDASRGAVETVLVNLERARLQKYLLLEDVGGRNVLEEYGLDPPHIMVTLRVRGSVLDTVLFGDSPMGVYVYVKKASEDRVGMVELYRRTGVDRGLAQLREKRALKFERGHARDLRIQGPGGTIEVARQEDGWQMKSPLETRGDEEEIRNILTKLSAPVKEFVDDTPASLGDYGLDPPRLRVEVTTADGAAHTLWIGGGAESGYYARSLSRASVFTVDSVLVDRLDEAASGLRFKHLLAFERKEVDRVEFAYPGRTVLCVREGMAWLAVPQQRPVNGIELDAILYNMEELRAEGFVSAQADGGSYGLDPPRARIRVWAEEQLVGDLALGAAEGEMVYARGSANDLACLVDREVAERLGVDRIFKEQGTSGGG